MRSILGIVVALALIDASSAFPLTLVQEQSSDGLNAGCLAVTDGPIKLDVDGVQHSAKVFWDTGASKTWMRMCKDTWREPHRNKVLTNGEDMLISLGGDLEKFRHWHYIRSEEDHDLRVPKNEAVPKRNETLLEQFFLNIAHVHRRQAGMNIHSLAAFSSPTFHDKTTTHTPFWRGKKDMKCGEMLKKLSEEDKPKTVVYLLQGKGEPKVDFPLFCKMDKQIQENLGVPPARVIMVMADSLSAVEGCEPEQMARMIKGASADALEIALRNPHMTVPQMRHAIATASSDRFLQKNFKRLSFKSRPMRFRENGTTGPPPPPPPGPPGPPPPPGSSLGSTRRGQRGPEVDTSTPVAADPEGYDVFAWFQGHGAPPSPNEEEESGAFFASSTSDAPDLFLSKLLQWKKEPQHSAKWNRFLLLAFLCHGFGNLRRQFNKDLIANDMFVMTNTDPGSMGVGAENDNAAQMFLDSLKVDGFAAKTCQDLSHTWTAKLMQQGDGKAWKPENVLKNRHERLWWDKMVNAWRARQSTLYHDGGQCFAHQLLGAANPLEMKTGYAKHGSGIASGVTKDSVAMHFGESVVSPEVILMAKWNGGVHVQPWDLLIGLGLESSDFNRGMYNGLFMKKMLDAGKTRFCFDLPQNKAFFGPCETTEAGAPIEVATVVGRTTKTVTMPAMTELTVNRLGGNSTKYRTNFDLLMDTGANVWVLPHGPFQENGKAAETEEWNDLDKSCQIETITAKVEHGSECFKMTFNHDHVTGTHECPFGKSRNDACTVVTIGEYTRAAGGNLGEDLHKSIMGTNMMKYFALEIEFEDLTAKTKVVPLNMKFFPRAGGATFANCT